MKAALACVAACACIGAVALIVLQGCAPCESALIAWIVTH
jgi:hypothetical protein